MTPRTFILVAGAVAAFGLTSADAIASEPSHGPSSDATACININTAPAAELTVLPGIGPTRAEAIVQARERRHFRRPEEILRVPGIGRSTFGRIRQYICVE